MKNDKKTQDIKPDLKKIIEDKKQPVLKGEVVVYFKTGAKEYPVGSVYETKCEKSFAYLINTKRIKKWQD